MKIDVQILTPTFVGTAKELDYDKNLDIIIKKDFKKEECEIFFLDSQKLYNHSNVNLDILSEALLKGTEMSKVLQSLKIDLKEVASRYEKVFVKDFASLKRHIFNGYDGKPYLPGSSIKGAIRGVAIHHLKPLHNKEKNKLELNEKVGNIQEDFFKYLQISDVPFDKTKLLNSKIFNLYRQNGWQGVWKNDAKNTEKAFEQDKFNTLYECLPRGAKSVLNIRINNDFLKLWQKNVFFFI